MNSIKELTYQNQYQDVSSIDNFNADKSLGTLTFQVEEINKLESFRLNMHFHKEGLQILNEGIQLDIQIILKDLHMGAFFQIEHEPEMFELTSQNKYQIVSIFMAGIVFSVILFVFLKMIQYYWKKTHPRRRKGEVSAHTERHASVSQEEN